MLGCFALRGNVLTILFSTDHSGNPDPGVSKYLENIQCFDKLTLLVGWQEGHPAYNNFPIPKDSSSFFLPRDAMRKRGLCCRPVNRKSYALYRMVTFQWPWRTLNPVFKVTALLESNTSKRCVLWTKLLQNANRKPYRIYRMVPLSMTLIDPLPGFLGRDIFPHWLSQKRHEIELL